MRERQKYADLLSEVLCVCAKDVTQKKKISLKFPKENFASAKLQAEKIVGIRVPGQTHLILA